MYTHRKCVLCHQCGIEMEEFFYSYNCQAESYKVGLFVCKRGRVHRLKPKLVYNFMNEYTIVLTVEDSDQFELKQIL